MPRDVDAVHRFRPERVGRDEAVAKAHDQHVRLRRQRAQQRLKLPGDLLRHRRKQRRVVRGNLIGIDGDVAPLGLIQPARGRVGRDLDAFDGHAVPLLARLLHAALAAARKVARLARQVRPVVLHACLLR